MFRTGLVLPQRIHLQQLAVQRTSHRHLLRLICWKHFLDCFEQMRLCLAIGTVEHAEELQAELGRGTLTEEGFFQFA